MDKAKTGNRERLRNKTETRNRARIRHKSTSRNIKNRLYIATACEQHRQILTEYGIGVELDQLCMPENLDGDAAASVCREIETLLPLASGCVLHGPFHELFPAAIDPKARNLAMERLNAAAWLADSYRAKKMVVHSGYAPQIYFKEWQRDRSVEFWHEFMAERPMDFQIVIENVMEDEPYMLAELAERLAHPRIKLCLDVGHAACASKVPVREWVQVLAPYLGHLHLHNNDGTGDLHQPLTEGVIDIKGVLDLVLDLCDADTSIAIESIDGLSSVAWLAAEGYL